MKSTRLFMAFSLWIFINPFFSQAAIIQWDGGGNDGQWMTAANWSGNALPLSSDDVVLDNSLLSGSYTVNLPAGAVTITVNSITITPVLNNTILLNLPPGNTANPGLAVTGPGNALVLNDHAVLKNSSGASAGSGITISSAFRISNGGQYIHNTARGNASIVSQLSSAAGTENGIFEFDVPVASYVLSLSGRNFGNLVLSSAANGGTISYSGSGANPLNINGDFHIKSGVNFSTSMSANFFVKGNYFQDTSSTFNLQSSLNNNTIHVKGNFISRGTITETNTGLPVLEFNGSLNQDIDAGTASFLNTIDFKINNPAGVSLLSQLVLPYRLTIAAGNIMLGNHNLVTGSINQLNAATMNSNHIVTNGSGSLKLNGLVNGIFPIGPSPSTYNPVTISGGGGNDFSARVESGINPSIAFPTWGINRTWHIHSSAAIPGVGLSFQYASADANTNAGQPQAMEILMNTGTAWNILPGNSNITPTGTDPSWVISAVTPVAINTSPVPFAIGVNGGWALPLNCLSCQAIPPRQAVPGKLEMSSWPNPVRDLLEINLKSPARDKLRLTVSDIQGQVIRQFFYSILKGNNRISIPVTELFPGTYFLKAETSIESRVLKFIKIK